MKTFLLVLALVLIAAAYVAGYLPEHGRLVESQETLQTTTTQLADAQARLRLYGLHNRLVRMIETVRERNYGAAAQLASVFFDATRAETGHVRDPQAAASLESVLATRDSVTSKLAVGDPTVADALNGAMGRLQQLIDTAAAKGSEAPAGSPAP